MIIALASPRVASSLDDGLERVRRLLAEASTHGAKIVCFPEAYLPGLRGMDFEVPPYDRAAQERTLKAATEWAREFDVTAVLGMEWVADEGHQIAAVVVGPDGAIRGVQTKNQLDPAEERHYVPGRGRRLFEIDGLRFGVAICHEGFRYPETVRWAAARGAHVVFHPHCTGSDKKGAVPASWGSPESPYYEKAMMCRALENTIYFASVNYAMRYQESATSLIAPTGECVAHLPYGAEGILTYAVDAAAATGALARRLAPERMVAREAPDGVPLSESLPGTWRLVSRVDATASGERIPEPSLGDDPVALLIYDRSGHFAAQFMKRDRSTILADAPEAGVNNSRAQGGYDAYFGTYTVDDAKGMVTQRLLGALSSENVGLVLTRGMTVSGDTLTIRLQTTAGGGVAVTRTLSWKRVG